MISQSDIQSVMGQTAYGLDGEKIGKVGQVYLDDVTSEPEWATVATGMFGGSESFVPLADAQLADGSLTLPYDKDLIKDAPRVDADGHLSQEQEGELYRHYGLQYTEAQSDSGLAGAPTTTTGGRGDSDGDGVFDDVEGKTVGQDTSGLTTDEAMTRSEERINVGTENVQTGKAKLRKYVVTEQQTVTVPVTREEVRMVREPITEANAGKAFDGPSISEEEHEVVLTQERAVVSKETVPVERVRLDVDTVTEEQQVTEDVRKEQIVTEGDIDVRGADASTKQQ